MKAAALVMFYNTFSYIFETMIYIKRYIQICKTRRKWVNRMGFGYRFVEVNSLICFPIACYLEITKKL